MKLLNIITVLGLVSLTYFIGDTYFYRISLSYENGRHFNETASTVYHEHAVTVYFLLFISAFIGAILATYSLIKAKRQARGVKL